LTSEILSVWNSAVNAIRWAELRRVRRKSRLPRGTTVIKTLGREPHGLRFLCYSAAWAATDVQKIDQAIFHCPRFQTESRANLLPVVDNEHGSEGAVDHDAGQCQRVEKSAGGEHADGW
jgi:hypothetical protein